MKYKHYLQSKTLWFSLATTCTGVGMFFSGEKTMEEFLVIVIGAVFAYLRTVTNTEVTK